MCKVMETLVTTLVHNHIQLCVPAPLRDEANSFLLAEAGACQSQTRAVIAVVGAGFSADAVGLPLGNETIRILKSELSVPESYLQQELRRLSIQYRLEPQEFETVLLALSRFVPSPLLDSLARIFGRRFYTSHSCELLAHLFKHRFIDAIINFNFDEVLDQAIEDELGRENYWKVVSDGDLPSDIDRLWDDDGRLKLPLLVKPHGTASHRSSMRFTREDYFLLPEGIHNLLIKCLQGTPLTVLTLGFGMQSVEFNAILREAVKQNNDIKAIAVDRNPEVIKRFPSEIPIEKCSFVTPGTNGFAGFFEDVWNKVKERFVKPGRYRGTERHALLAALFKDPVQATKPEEERKGSLRNYLRDRTLVEIALATAKAKGFVNVGQLQSSRAGKYLHRYLEKFPDAHETLYTFCDCLGLCRVGYARDTLRLPVEGENPDQLIISRDGWDTASSQLIASLRGQLSEARRKILESETSLVTDVLQVMYQGEEVEICTPVNLPHCALFENPLELRSLVATNVYTIRLLKNNKWNLLLCVGETAEWLLQDPVVNAICQQDSRRLCVIVADRAHENNLKSKYRKQNIEIEIVELPWWLHNQHMTITVSNSELYEALYFERRQRSLTITPLGLGNAGDLNTIFNVFVAYWVKANQYGTHGTQLFVGNNDLEEAKRQILNSR